MLTETIKPRTTTAVWVVFVLFLAVLGSCTSHGIHGSTVENAETKAEPERTGTVPKEKEEIETNHNKQPPPREGYADDAIMEGVQRMLAIGLDGSTENEVGDVVGKKVGDKDENTRQDDATAGHAGRGHRRGIVKWDPNARQRCGGSGGGGAGGYGDPAVGAREQGGEEQQEEEELVDEEEEDDDDDEEEGDDTGEDDAGEGGKAKERRSDRRQHSRKPMNMDDRKEARKRKKDRRDGPPNVIVIMADDVGTDDVSFWWGDRSKQNPKVPQPHLQELAQKGIMFTDMHSTPLCSSSRYQLLTGNYPHRSRSIFTANYVKDHNTIRPRQKTIAQALRDGGAGYHTAMFGKWHLGTRYPPDGQKYFDEPRRPFTWPEHDWTLPLGEGPQTIGFDYSYITMQGLKGPYAFLKDGYLVPSMDEIRFWPPGEYPMPMGLSHIWYKSPGDEGDVNWDTCAYNQILVNETEAFVQRHLKERPNDPFFAYVALGMVHNPHSPPDKYMDGDQIAGRFPMSRQKDLLYEMDKIVGSLVDIIESNGLAEETVIIFTSDNGGLPPYQVDDGAITNGPLRGSKHEIYEGGHRVPFIIRADGRFPAGEIRTRLASHVDLYSTICELAGAEVPYNSGTDSQSILPYILSSNNTEGLRTSLFTGNLAPIGAGVDSIRMGNMKLVCWHSRSKRNVRLELYDLSQDIGEQENLIDRKEYHRLVWKMFTKLQKVGPCPDDAKGMFKIINNGTPQLVNCSYFVNNTDQCEMHWRGEQMCNSICGRHHLFCDRPNAFRENKEKKKNLSNLTLGLYEDDDNGGDSEFDLMEEKSSVNGEFDLMEEKSSVNYVGEEGDYEEGDYEEGDYEEGDYEEGDYEEGDYEEGRYEGTSVDGTWVEHTYTDRNGQVHKLMYEQTDDP